MLFLFECPSNFPAIRACALTFEALILSPIVSALSMSQTAYPIGFMLRLSGCKWNAGDFGMKFERKLELIEPKRPSRFSFDRIPAG